MIGIIITIIMLGLFTFSLIMAYYNDSNFWGVIAAVCFMSAFIIGVGIIPVSSNKERDIQYKQDILELKLLEQRIELYDLQIEQLKLNISNK